MLRIAAGIVFTCVSLGGLLVPGPSSAQRPSLAELEAQVERNRSAMCAMAEFDGGTYRPFVCEPAACRECLTGSQIAQFASFQSVTCAEGPAFEFTVTGSSSFGSCTISGCDGGLCSGSLGGSCENEPCPAGETCVAGPLGTDDFCIRPCTTDAECVGLTPNFCDGSWGVSCTSNADCDEGLECELGTCRRSCTGGCAPSTSTTLSNVKGPDSTEPAFCGADPYNSADVLACLSEIEVTYGIACTTICGNGVLQAGEECDDGNVNSGDGCDGSCQNE